MILPRIMVDLRTRASKRCSHASQNLSIRCVAAGYSLSSYPEPVRKISDHQDFKKISLCSAWEFLFTILYDLSVDLTDNTGWVILNYISYFCFLYVFIALSVTSKNFTSNPKSMNKDRPPSSSFLLHYHDRNWISRY